MRFTQCLSMGSSKVGRVYPHEWLDYVATGCRKRFVFPTKAKHDWFPGHMRRGLNQMERVLGDVDCIVEVHDARIGLSGRNHRFKQHITGLHLPHVLALNKCDLINTKDYGKMADVVKGRDEDLDDVIFTNCKLVNHKGIHKVDGL